MTEKKNAEKNYIGHDLNLLAKSSFVVFIGLVLSKILTYVYRIITARYFGPEVYGLFTLSLMILLAIIAFSSFGLAEGLVRFIPIYQGKNELNKIQNLIKKTFWFVFISSFISAAILFFSAEFISVFIFNEEGLTIFLKVFSFLIPIYIFAQIFYSIIRAYEKISWYSFIFNILQNLVKAIVLVILVLIGFDFSAVIFSYFLGILSMLIVAFLVCKYKLSEIFGEYKLDSKIKKAEYKKFFSYSWPIMFISTISIVFYWVDSFAIGFFKDALNVGIYNAAIPIAALIGIAPELFLQLFFPLINREYSKKKIKVIEQISKQVVKWIFILVLPLFLIMFLFPGALINMLFGFQYLEAETALKILSIGAFISAILVIIPTSLISMIGKSKLLLTNLIIILIINIILNSILIPKYGITGAAFATTLAHSLLGITLLIETKIYLSIVPLRRKMIRIFLISLIPTISTLYIRKLIQTDLIGLLFLGSFFCLLYIALIFTTGCLDKNDFLVIKSIKKLVNHNYI